MHKLFWPLSCSYFHKDVEKQSPILAMTTMSSQQRWPVESRQNQRVSLNKQWDHKCWLDQGTFGEG
jgi:hypothetical protein